MAFATFIRRKSISTQTKFIVGFSSIVAMTCILGILSIIETARMGNLADALYDKSLTTIDAAHAAQTSFMKLDRIVAAGGARSDEADRAARIAELNASITDNLNTIQEAMSDRYGDGLVAEIRLEFDQLRELQDATAADAAAGHPAHDDSATSLMSDNDALAARIAEQLDLLIESAKAEGFDSRERTRDIGQLMSKVIAATFGVAVLEVVIAGLSARGVSRPIARIGGALAEIANNRRVLSDSAAA